MSLSPTQRTIRELKNQGRTCGIVERFISNTSFGHGIRSDLFHIFDIVALDSARGIIGIQTCGADFAAHFRKMTEEYGHNTLEWIKCGGVAELWSWRKIKARRGGKLMLWKPRIKEIRLEDFADDTGAMGDNQVLQVG